jgi:WD repeat-containing protein 45
MDLTQNQLSDMLWIDVNQDQSCFVVGTETGYRIYQTDPLEHTHSRVFPGAGGLGIVGMLFRSNVLALVGGGRNPRYPPSKVIIWDDKESRAIAELTFRTSVKSVKLRRDIVVVGVESKVYVYKFSDLCLIDTLDCERVGGVAFTELTGLVSVSGSPDRTVVAAPGNVKGKINICFYESEKRVKVTPISAHQSELAIVSLNFDGSLVATASVKGTLIRVFDTNTGNRIAELRRGAENVDIYSISFNMASDWIAVSSDKGTVHVFSLRSGELAEDMNQRSSLGPLAHVLPSYFQSQWSFAQFRVPDYRSICTFGKDPCTVICLCADGSYYKAKFDPVMGGEMKRVRLENFFT